MAVNPFAPSTDPNDRIMAALAQVTVLIPLIGVIAPIVIWVTQRDRSRYVSFQALQAVVFQLLMVLSWVLGMGCYLFSFFGTFLFTIPLASASNGSTDPAVGLLAMLPIFFPFVVMGLMMFGFFVFIVYGCIAAVQVFRGKDFRYLLIGNWLSRYLQKDRPLAT